MVKITRHRITLFLLLAFVFLTIQASLPQKAHAQSNVYVASLDQNIDPGAEDFVVTSINEATSARIHNFIVILPGTVIGSATPIVSGIPIGEENTTLTKDISAFTQYMVTLTKHNNRNYNATALMVTKGVSYDCGTATSCSAYQQNVINAVLPANNTQQALTTLHAGDAPIHTAGTRSIFLSVISDPNLDSILFLAGVFAILADLYHPTIIFTVVGASAIALALLGLGVFGAPIVSIVLMMIGAIFIFGFLLIFSLPSSTPAPSSAPSGSGTFIQIGVLTYTILGIVGGGGVLGSIYLYRVR